MEAAPVDQTTVRRRAMAGGVVAGMCVALAVAMPVSWPWTILIGWFLVSIPVSVVVGAILDARFSGSGPAIRHVPLAASA
jgi:uncharacterized membrane protein